MDFRQWAVELEIEWQRNKMNGKTNKKNIFVFDAP